MDYTPYTDDELLRRIDLMPEAELTPLTVELSSRLRRALDELDRMAAEEAHGNDTGGSREGGRKEVAANEGRVVLLASKQRYGQARHS